MFQNACINYQQLLNKLEEVMLKNQLLTQQYNDLFRQTVQIMEENKALHEKNGQIHERFNQVYSHYDTLYQDHVKLKLDLETKQIKLQEKKKVTKKLLSEIAASKDEIETLENMLNFSEHTETDTENKVVHVANAKSKPSNSYFFPGTSPVQAQASSYTHTLISRAASTH